MELHDDRMVGVAAVAHAPDADGVVYTGAQLHDVLKALKGSYVFVDDEPRPDTLVPVRKAIAVVMSAIIHENTVLVVRARPLRSPAGCAIGEESDGDAAVPLAKAGKIGFSLRSYGVIGEDGSIHGMVFSHVCASRVTQ